MIICVRDTSADEIESRIDLESPRLTLNRCSVQSNIALLMTAVDIVGSHTKTHRVSETSGPLLVSSFPSFPFFFFLFRLVSFSLLTAGLLEKVAAVVAVPRIVGGAVDTWARGLCRRKLSSREHKRTATPTVRVAIRRRSLH